MSNTTGWLNRLTIEYDYVENIISHPLRNPISCDCCLCYSTSNDDRSPVVMISVVVVTVVVILVLVLVVVVATVMRVGFVVVTIGGVVVVALLEVVVAVVIVTVVVRALACAGPVIDRLVEVFTVDMRVDVLDIVSNVAVDLLMNALTDTNVTF